jgi:hypothetical protein
VLKYGFCEALREKVWALLGEDASGLVSLLSADSLPEAQCSLLGESEGE